LIERGLVTIPPDLYLSPEKERLAQATSAICEVADQNPAAFHLALRQLAGALEPVPAPEATPAPVIQTASPAPAVLTPTFATATPAAAAPAPAAPPPMTRATAYSPQATASRYQYQRPSTTASSNRGRNLLIGIIVFALIVAAAFVVLQSQGAPQRAAAPTVAQPTQVAAQPTTAQPTQAATIAPPKMVSAADIKLTRPITVGTWTTLPAMPPYMLYDMSLWVLNDEPTVTMTGAWTVKIDFTTVISTTPATVYYGTFDPIALLPRVRYVGAVQEKYSGVSTQHSVTIPISPTLTSTGNDFVQMRQKGGGVVAYRIELVNPGTRLFDTPASVAYDRRFEFYNGKLVPTVVQGPFVNLITPTGATISWDTDQPVNGMVKLGKGDVQSTATKTTHFEVPLTGLTAGSTYTYSVQIIDGTNTTATREYYFNTPPQRATKFDFTVMGDARAGLGSAEFNFGGTNYAVVKQEFTNAFNRKAAFVVYNGDFEWGFSSFPQDLALQLRSFKDAIEQVAHYIPLYAVQGNHELSWNVYLDTNMMAQPPKPPVDPGSAAAYFIMLDKEPPNSGEEVFAQAFVNPTNGPDPIPPANLPAGKTMPPYKETVYSFDYGNSRFVVLNTSYFYSNYAEKYGGYQYGYIADDQAAWLINEFNKAAADPSIDHLFLVGHTPFFPTSAHVTGGMWVSGGDPARNGGVDRTYMVARRDQIWQAFVNTGKAVAYMSSDEHNYSRTWATKDRNGNAFANPAWQLITGGGGAPMSANPLSTLVPWASDVKMLTPQLHYIMIHVDGKKVTADVYNVDNQLIESVVLKNADGVLTPQGK
jgi:hypothetical protein